MKLETFSYTGQTGWSIKDFPKLDSERTWIIIFGSPKSNHDLNHHL